MPCLVRSYWGGVSAACTSAHHPAPSVVPKPDADCRLLVSDRKFRLRPARCHNRHLSPVLLPDTSAWPGEATAPGVSPAGGCVEHQEKKPADSTKYSVASAVVTSGREVETVLTDPGEGFDGGRYRNECPE